MTKAPETRYAKTADGLHIAYQVLGDGSRDLIVAPGWVSHVEFWWELPDWSAFFWRLASFHRVLLFDKPGTGLSDRPSQREMPTLEERMDALRAVMDAAGSERAAVLGWSEGGPMSIVFAASYPARTTALVLYGSFARWLTADDYSIGYAPEVAETVTAAIVEAWGTGEMTRRLLAPGAPPERQASMARFERLGCSPGGVGALLRLAAQWDVRAVLPLVSAPTLILHRRGDTAAPIELSRYMAARIPGARLVELEGADHMPVFGDAVSILDEIEEFLTGVRRGPDADRVLATVLFTDIVGSTERASTLGDRGWRGLLDFHDALVRRELERHRGREVKTTGDGVLATFDGPARAISCATAIGDAVRTLGLEVRSGLHTGEVELRGEDIGGVAVHIAARINAMAGPGEVLVSRTVKDLVVGSGIRFNDRGTHALKGVQDEWQLFAVEA